jgi:hypothetical protein
MKYFKMCFIKELKIEIFKIEIVKQRKHFFLKYC